MLCCIFPDAGSRNSGCYKGVRSNRDIRNSSRWTCVGILYCKCLNRKGLILTGQVEIAVLYVGLKLDLKGISME